MKKLLLIVLMFMMTAIGFSAKKTKTMEYEGVYLRATNTFTHKKNNLIFPDKSKTYQVVDKSNLLDGIYEFIGQNYGVTDDDIVGLKLNGTVSGNTLTISKITNYRIPLDKVPGAMENMSIENELGEVIDVTKLNQLNSNDRINGVSNTEIEEIEIPEIKRTID